MTPEERAEAVSEWWADAQHEEQWGELREEITVAIRQAEAVARAEEREACAKFVNSRRHEGETDLRSIRDCIRNGWHIEELEESND